MTLDLSVIRSQFPSLDRPAIFFDNPGYGSKASKEKLAIMESQRRTMKLIQTAAFGVPEFEMKAEWRYRPRILPDHLRRLWFTKQKTGKAITKLIAEALDFYFESAERG